MTVLCTWKHDLIIPTKTGVAHSVGVVVVCTCRSVQVQVKISHYINPGVEISKAIRCSHYIIHRFQNYIIFSPLCPFQQIGRLVDVDWNEHGDGKVFLLGVHAYLKPSADPDCDHGVSKADICDNSCLMRCISLPISMETFFRITDSQVHYYIFIYLCAQHASDLLFDLSEKAQQVPPPWYIQHASDMCKDMSRFFSVCFVS